jgi:hypothetical protein
MYDKLDDLPYFMALQKIAEEIGVDPQTITRHPSAFFPTVRLGNKHFAATAKYKSWLRARLSEATGEPAHC